MLKQVVPVYEEFEAFPGSLAGVRTYADLPPQVQRYLRYVEQFVGVPIRYACIGRRRDQILARDPA